MALTITAEIGPRDARSAVDNAKAPILLKCLQIRECRQRQQCLDVAHGRIGTEPTALGYKHNLALPPASLLLPSLEEKFPEYLQVSGKAIDTSHDVNVLGWVLQLLDQLVKVVDRQLVSKPAFQFLRI